MVAIITGASSGLGEEFVKQITTIFPEIDEFWLIARRKEKIEKFANELEYKKIKILSLDLSDDKSYEELNQILKEEKPNVKLLINNAGLGYYGPVKDISVERQVNMIDVNVKALTAVSRIVLDYMEANAKILLVSSIASFVPNANMTVYSSTKAYVTSFARGLRYELKKQKISVTVTCPGPMSTEFIEKAEIKSKTFDTLPYCNVQKVVKGSLKATKKGKFMHVPKGFYKLYRFLAKAIPHAWLMGITKT